MKGKSIFLWQRWSVDGANPGEIARRLQDLNMEAVLIKTADGPRKYRHWRHGDNATLRFIGALNAADIETWGWSFCYGRDWRGEGEIAAIEVNRLGLAGHVFDVEGAALTRANADRNVPGTIDIFKRSATGKPTGFLSFALFHDPDRPRNFHPWTVLIEAMRVADFGMPMTYWYKNHSVADYREPETIVHESISQWRRVTDKPIIPIGRAYDGEGDYVEVTDYDRFYEACADTGSPGWSFWSLQHVPHRSFEMLASIPRGDHMNPPPLTVEERLDRLERKVFGLSQ